MITGLSGAAADDLFTYWWPGNLRELDRVIHAAVAMTTGNVIGPEAVILDGRPAAAPIRGADCVSLPAAEDSSLKAMESRHVRLVLEKLGGNKARAAKVLRISRSTLDRKLARYQRASE